MINVPSGIYSLSKYLQNSFLITANGPMLYVLDSVLDFQVGMNYGISGFNRRLHKAFAFEDGHVFAVGTNLQNPDILILKTDSLLNAGCYSYNSIMFSTVAPAITKDTLVYTLLDSGFITSEHDSIGNGIWQESILCISSGLHSADYESDFIKIYPNPSIDFIVVDNIVRNFPIKSIQIYSLDGKIIYEHIWDDLNFESKTIDISNYSSGVYILNVTFVNNTSSKVKVLKMSQ